MAAAWQEQPAHADFLLSACLCPLLLFFNGLKTVLLKPRALREVETTSFITRRKMLVPLPPKCRAERFTTVQLASVSVAEEGRVAAGAGVYFWIAVVPFWIPWPRLEPHPNYHLETEKACSSWRDGS